MIHFWYMGCANSLNCYMSLLGYIWLDGLWPKKARPNTCIYHAKVVYRDTSCLVFLGKGNNYGGLRKYRKSFCIHDEWRKHW